MLGCHLRVNEFCACRKKLKTTRMQQDHQLSPRFPIGRSETPGAGGLDAMGVPGRVGPQLSSGGSKWVEWQPQSCFGQQGAWCPCGVG